MRISTKIKEDAEVRENLPFFFRRDCVNQNTAAAAYLAQVKSEKLLADMKRGMTKS